MAYGPRLGTLSTRAFGPLGVITTGPCVVSGTALDVDGSPLVGVDVDWGYYDSSGNYYYGNSATTGSDGSFSFTGVTAQDDGVLVWGVDQQDYCWRHNLTFTATGPNAFTLQAGTVDFSATKMPVSRGFGYGQWNQATVDTYGTDGGAVTVVDADSTGASGSVFVVAPDVSYACVYFFSDDAVEWQSDPQDVQPGVDNNVSIAVDEADGQRMWPLLPAWCSGKAGVIVDMVMENWPSGYEATFYGYSQDPRNSRVMDYAGTFTSNGDGLTERTLKVPTWATAGYDYELHAYRSDTTNSSLDLTQYYQVCTLKASASSVARGRAIRLSGVIPTAGHWGSTAGKAKYVRLYSRSRSISTNLTPWDAAKKGWHLVGTYKANGYGKYRTGYLRPSKTKWYVVRYPGDSWYYRSFTSVIRVRVH
jgi:hypothetical protein